MCKAACSLFTVQCSIVIMRSRLLGCFFLLAASASAQLKSVTRFPADNATGVNPDTHLVLTFPSAPTLGKSGQIRIYEAGTNKLVDTLDMSIPPGPTKPASGPAAPYTPAPYEYVSGRFTNLINVPVTQSGVDW